MCIWKQRKQIKNLAVVLGVVLWVGILGPEIFVKSGPGCIVDDNGEALTTEDAKDFMELYFYGNANQEDEQEAAVRVKYKLALLELFE